MQKNRSGQVLIELLLAFAVSSVALVSMAQIATKSVTNATYSKNRSEADKYAVKSMEWIRSQRNTLPWLTFIGVSGIKCVSLDPLPPVTGMGAACTCTYLQDANAAYTDDPNPNCHHPTLFKENVTFTPTGTNQQVVTVNVNWSDKTGIQSSTQTIIFKQY